MFVRKSDQITKQDSTKTEIPNKISQASSILKKIQIKVAKIVPTCMDKPQIGW